MTNNFDQKLQQALDLHREGDVRGANQLYRELFELAPDRLDIMHNLGATLLGLGHYREGTELVSKAIKSDSSNPGMADSFKMLGMELYKANYWEQATPWLLDALQQNPDDAEVVQALARIEPRLYLEPEKFDHTSARTLLRYSPRETGTYVYTIDIVGNCNLACPSCPVGNSSDTGRFKKMMTLPVFDQVLSKICKESPVAKPQIWLYNWGEPLLHPKLPEIIERIHQAGYTSHLSSNLNIEKGLKALIKTRPTEIKISISGFSTETYSVTHSKGNINLVKSNMYRLRQYLDHYKSPTRIWVGQHIYKNNHHEIEELSKLCIELDFEHHPIQAFYQPLEKLIDLAEGKQDVENDDLMKLFMVPPKEQLSFLNSNKQPDYDCELRFNQTVINADASVATCCSQYQSKNALGISFLDHTREDIEDRKYKSALCKTCRHHGLDYAPKQLAKSTHIEQT